MRRLGHVGAALREQLHDLLVRQPGQHLADAGAADAEDVGHALLAQLGAGMQAVLEDGDVDPLVDLVDGLLALGAGGVLRAVAGMDRWGCGVGVAGDSIGGLPRRLRSIGTAPPAGDRGRRAPAARTMPQTVVLTVSSSGMPCVRSTARRSGARAGWCRRW
jgi:hypothetical protein